MSVGNPVMCVECGYLHGQHAIGCTRQRIGELEESVNELRTLKQEVERLRGILREIWRICHIPSHGRHAYTHFQSDFDQIRALCKPYLDDSDAERSGKSRTVRGPPAASGP